MTDAFADPSAQRRIAILPLGATEQHGPHLPPETDAIIAGRLAQAAAARVRPALAVDVLPVEAVGYSIEHAGFPGTRSLSFAAAVERWVAAGERVFAAGGRRLLLLNAHGGNAPLMTIAATELRARHPMLVATTSWTRFGYPAEVVDARERALGIHAGFIETSVMLALAPELVAMDKAADFASAQAGFEDRFRHLRAYGPHAFGWMMRDLSPEGATGNAAAASAAAGRRIVDHAVEGLAELLADIAAFDLGHFDAAPAR
ncbi:creatininase family protein [Aquibium sp. A9E412]|uniref:creatininase family protein n=1 Tax=Aquibium sp. A9E412 TaxID=2976767 RepID=UPI0025B0CE03|nr:creatininase family protein [Aquibium sp. A9E412]MDN2565148.1 creatininase family protein [Aquibium sp. A9E412]